MGRITYENLMSEARVNLLALISNNNNVSDPIKSSAQHRKWIYSREPDVKSSDFKGYPYIILPPSDFSPEKEGGSLDMKSKAVIFDLEIEIVTSDRGYGSKDGQGMTHMDSISNAIMKTLLNKTNRLTLQSYGMFFSNPEPGPVDTETRNNELVYVRTIALEYGGRMQISA